MDKTVRTVLISIGFGILVGAGVCWAVLQGGYNRQIELLTSDLRVSQEYGNSVAQSLRSADARVTGLGDQISRLEEQRASDNRQHELEYNRLTQGLKQLSSGLGQTGQDLDQAIDGLEQLKTFVRSLP